MNVQHVATRLSVAIARRSDLVRAAWWLAVILAVLGSCEPVLAHARPWRAGAEVGALVPRPRPAAGDANVAERAASGEYTP